MSRTNKSYRRAITVSQGIGYSENTGSSWPMPEARVGTVVIYDSNNQLRSLVLDSSDGKLWDISTRDTYNESKIWKDKVTLDGNGDPDLTTGTDIVPSVTFPEDRGSVEHYFLEHLGTHFYLRPEDENNRDASGFDSNGYPTGTTFASYAYVDGEPDTDTASAADIGIKGEIVYDRLVRGHRIQHKFTGDKAQFQLMGRQSYFKAQDVPEAPADRITTEGDYNTAVAAVTKWYSRGASLLLDRVSGTTSSSTVTATTGPDGNTASAMSFTSSVNLGSIDLTNGMILLWHQSLDSITVDGVDVSGSLVTVTTSGSWTLSKLATYTGSGDLVLVPSGTGKAFDVRVYSSDLSTAAIAYYHQDITENSGNSVCPWA